MTEHCKIDLAALAIVGAPGPLPSELRGTLSDADLADLSWTDETLGLHGYGFWPVERAAATYDPATQRLSGEVSRLPDADRRVVVETPLVVDLTPDEIEALRPPVPATVTNFQARAALLNAGLFDRVNDALLALPANSTARQAWEYANDLTRNGTLVNSMAETLGLTATQLDDLFRHAATIEA